MEQLRGIKLKRFKKELKRSELDVVIILENLQYARNVAEIFRIADTLKVSEVIITGISKSPPFGKDLQKVSRSKEKSVKWQAIATTGKAIDFFSKKGYEITAIELTDSSISIFDYNLPANKKIVLLVGNEVYGLTKDTLSKVDKAVYLPIYGKGASLNVSIAAAITLYLLIMK